MHTAHFKEPACTYFTYGYVKDIQTGLIALPLQRTLYALATEPPPTCPFI